MGLESTVWHHISASLGNKYKYHNAAVGMERARQCLGTERKVVVSAKTELRSLHITVSSRQVSTEEGQSHIRFCLFSALGMAVATCGMEPCDW